MLTSSSLETIIWNATTFVSLVTIEDNVTLIESTNGFIHGLLHDGLYKKWSNTLIENLMDQDEVEGQE